MQKEESARVSVPTVVAISVASFLIEAVASTDHLAKQFAQLIKGLTVVRELDQPYDDEVKLALVTAS